MLGFVFTTLVIIFAIIGFIANRIRKARMRNALGRDVADSEMTSLNSWMQVVENEDRKRRP